MISIITAIMVSNLHADCMYITLTAFSEPLQVAYLDPPPAYEEYYRKTNDTDLCGNATNQLPIQEQPRTIRVR